MLTAAHRTTKQAQEVAATSKGELVTIPADAKAAALTETGTIAGPIRLIGMIVISGTESAQMTVAADGNTVLAWKTTGSGNISGFTLPCPVACPNGITATKNFGSGGVFLVYYVEG